MTTPGDQPPPGYGQLPPPGYGQPTGYGPPGQIRSTGMWMLLFFVTCGIAGFVWFYQVHEEMKRHSGQGLGGLVALLIAFVFGLISPFFTSDEIGKLYQRAGQPPPVNAMTALWYFPGMFILVGPFVWFVKTNDAINNYWRACGVQG